MGDDQQEWPVGGSIMANIGQFGPNNGGQKPNKEVLNNYMALWP